MSDNSAVKDNSENDDVIDYGRANRLLGIRRVDSFFYNKQ